MTRREKVLAVCLAGTLGGLGLASLVNWGVVQPLRHVERQIEDEQKLRGRLSASLKDLHGVEKRWEELTGRTLAGAWDAREAQRRFREDMHQLLERHGLDDPKVRPGSFIKYKDDSVGVPLTINATGTLNEIVGFLCDFYCRDYLARLDKVRVTADKSVVSNVNSTRRAGRGARGSRSSSAQRNGSFGRDGPRLKLSVSAVTIALPRLGKLKHPVMEGIVEGENGRLIRERTAYNAIFTKNPFAPYEPRVAVKPPDHTPTTRQPTPTQPSRPEPNPRAGADQIFLKGVTCLDGEYTAYVYDDRRLDQPPTLYHLDDKIDDGELILIHPRGLVVRVEKDGRETDYFYPLRFPDPASFAEREELAADEHPEVWEALEREFVAYDSAARSD